MLIINSQHFNEEERKNIEEEVNRLKDGGLNNHAIQKKIANMFNCSVSLFNTKGNYVLNCNPILYKDLVDIGNFE